MVGANSDPRQTLAVMASRETSSITTPEGVVKKRKASSPLEDARGSRGLAVVVAFRKLITAAEQLVKASEKTSPTKKTQWPPSLKNMVARLWNSVDEYRELRYELDLEFIALEETVAAAPAAEVPKEKPACTDASTSMELIPRVVGLGDGR